MYQLFQSCVSLKKLSLEHCTLDDKVCQMLGQNEQLETLNMSMCYGLNESSIETIMSGCKKLDNLNLAWTDLNKQCLQLVCTTAPTTLQRINISGCRQTLLDDREFASTQFTLEIWCFFYAFCWLTTSDVIALCRRCPNLVELDVSDSSLITQTSVNFIHENLHRLEYLAMSRCYGVQISAFL